MSNPRGKPPADTPALQLSSSQLVWAICTLLLIGMFLFIAGIMVQRLTGPDQQVAANAATDSNPPSQPQVATSEGAAKGYQITPRPVTLPPSQSTSTEAPPSKPVTARDASSTYVPAPPPRRPETENKMESQSAPAAAPQPTQAAPKPPVPSVQEPVKVAEAPKPSPPAQPSPTSASNVSLSGQFTIQVAAFEGTKREAAETYKRRVDENSEYEVVLVTTNDGKYIRACIGNYPDRDSATKAREELLKLKGFADCIVKSAADVAR